MKQDEDIQHSLIEQKLCVGVKWTEEDRTSGTGQGQSWLYLILISCRHKAGVPSAVRARHWLPSLPVTAFIYSTQVTNKWQGHTHHHHTHRAHVPNSKGGGGGSSSKVNTEVWACLASALMNEPQPWKCARRQQTVRARPGRCRW